MLQGPHRVTVLTAAIIIQKSKSFSLYLPDLIKILITLLVTCKLFYPICQPFFHTLSNVNEAENKNSNTVIPSYWDNFPLTCQHTNGLELYDILFKHSLIKLTMLKPIEATPGIDLYILLAITILNVNPSIVHFWKSTASFIYCNESIFQTKIVIVSSYVKAMWELEFGNGNTHNSSHVGSADTLACPQKDFVADIL